MTMVKVILLEQRYNLSDPQMEEALGVRWTPKFGQVAKRESRS